MALLPRGASAHAFLVESSPSDRSQVASSPAEVRLTFSEPVAAPPTSSMALATSAGRNLPLSAQLSGGGTELRVDAPTLFTDAYVVRWHVVSTDDGHASDGSFSFAVGAAGALPPPRTSTSISWLEAALQAGLLIGLAAGSGGLAAERYLWPLTGAVRRRLDTWVLRPAVSLALVSGVLSLALVVSRFADGSGQAAGSAWSRAVTTRVGAETLATAALTMAASLAMAVRRRTAALVALMAAIVAVGLRSHPAAGAWWSTAAVVAHVLLALLWLGALLVFALAVAGWWRKDLPAGAIWAGTRRYARAALATAAIVVGTGIAAAFAELASPAQLVTDTYGRILLAKSAVVLAALALALLTRRGLRDRRRDQRNVTGARSASRAEVASFAVVLIAAATLSVVAPPQTSSAATPAASAPAPSVVEGVRGTPHLHLATYVGELAAFVTVASDHVVVAVRNPEYQPATDTVVDIELGPAGHASTLPGLRACGPGCATAPVAIQSGTTELRIVLRSSRWSAGSAQLTVPWPAQPADRALLHNVIAAMRTQPTLTVSETVSSGPGHTASDAITESGAQYLRGEPYGPTVTDVGVLPPVAGHRQLVVFFGASFVWARLLVDEHDRVVDEQLIDAGHQVQRTVAYPAG